VTAAHGGSGGGFNVESLFLAVPLIVLGVALFMQKSAPPAVPVAIVGIGLLFAVGGFSFLAGSETRYEAMFHSLCDATDRADEDPDAAATLFNDEVHSPLHAFADEVAQKDRVAAADVLRTKQQVEAAIAEGEDLGPVLIALTAAVRDAGPAVGEEALTCAGS
jgi:hypothetical protein